MRFAVLLTGDASPYTHEKYGTYADLFEDLIREEGDKWDVFDVRDFAFPDSFADYDAVIVTGSASDAHGSDPWIAELEEALRRARSQETKLLGFCFGHQAIANALGGRSNRNPSGWEAGVYTMELSDERGAFSFMTGVDSLDLLEIHQDHVVTVPPGAKVLASTPGTPVQIYAIGDQVLGIQGHPEFHNDIVHDLVDRRADAGVFSKEEAQGFLKRLEKPQDRDILQKMIKHFLGR